MNDLRPAKLIASTILASTGALSVALGNHRGEGLAMLVGLTLMAFGVPLLVMEWRGPKRRLPRDLEEAPERDLETGFKEAKDY